MRDFIHEETGYNTVDRTVSPLLFLIPFLHSYEYARQLNRQKSMPNTTQSQSSSSVVPVTQPLPFLNNISPLDPLPLIPTAATPMIQLPDGTHIALEDLMELIAAQRFSSPIHLYRQPNPM